MNATQRRIVIFFLVTYALSWFGWLGNWLAPSEYWPLPMNPLGPIVAAPLVIWLTEGRDEAGIQKAIDEYLELGMFFDNGLKAQAEMNVEALVRATDVWLHADDRARLVAQQHQSMRWTYLGSGMTHPKFVATLTAMSPAARDRIAEVAPAFS